jgi:prepilin-type N-terminal cleavage/methylation domain-containing protein
MPRRLATPKPSLAGFTLIELMVTITIIAILSSLTLAGLAVARQRVKADRTELTIRKIHEVVLPQYEKFLTRSIPDPTYLVVGNTLRDNLSKKGSKLIAKRRMMARELPDGWKDLRAPDSGTNPNFGSYESGISRRLVSAAIATGTAPVAAQFSDAECLWLTVIRGGYADPAIVGNFREDEFGDKDGDGQREFIDGWGNPIRFLRWAPGFVSRYQPLRANAASADTRSHDAFDQAGLDPVARITLYPLIFSGGPDGLPDIKHRDDESGNFTYAGVGYDPYFITDHTAYPSYFSAAGISPPIRTEPGSHLKFVLPAGTVDLGQYTVGGAQYGGRVFGAFNDGIFTTAGAVAGGNLSAASDDVHNHAMSR